MTFISPEAYRFSDSDLSLSSITIGLTLFETFLGLLQLLQRYTQVAMKHKRVTSMAPPVATNLNKLLCYLFLSFICTVSVISTFELRFCSGSSYSVPSSSSDFSELSPSPFSLSVSSSVSSAESSFSAASLAAK